MGFKSKALAELIGMNKSNYALHEQGKFHFKGKSLYKIAKKLGVPIDYFCEGFVEEVE